MYIHEYVLSFDIRVDYFMLREQTKRLCYLVDQGF